MSSKKLTGDQLRKFRSDVSKLKAKGLTSKRVDARSQKPTRHMREQVKKFGDVLSGKAKVIHVPKRKDAKGFETKYRVKGKSVVIPTPRGERVSYSAKDEMIVKRGKGRRGSPFREEIYSDFASEEKRSGKSGNFDARMRAKAAKGFSFRIPLGSGSWTLDDWDEMIKFMEAYETDPTHPYKNWRRYIELVGPDDGDE